MQTVPLALSTVEIDISRRHLYRNHVLLPVLAYPISVHAHIAAADSLVVPREGHNRTYSLVGHAYLGLYQSSSLEGFL